jgi:hypothetical protein
MEVINHRKANRRYKHTSPRKEADERHGKRSEHQTRADTAQYHYKSTAAHRGGEHKKIKPRPENNACILFGKIRLNTHHYRRLFDNEGHNYREKENDRKQRNCKHQRKNG